MLKKKENKKGNFYVLIKLKNNENQLEQKLHSLCIFVSSFLQLYKLWTYTQKTTGLDQNVVTASLASPSCDEARTFHSPELSDMQLSKLLELKQWSGKFLSMYLGHSASSVLISGPIFLPLWSWPIALRQQWMCEGHPAPQVIQDATSSRKHFVIPPA